VSDKLNKGNNVNQIKSIPLTHVLEISINPNVYMAINSREEYFRL
jgi:hypothetical protein